jgi:pimeloyl-ACP methyl ester carboxylesterase
MSLIVCVHGIGNQLEAAPTIAARWEPALLGGLGLAGYRASPGILKSAAYGHLFRPSGRLRSAGEHFHSSDLSDDDLALLKDLLMEAQRAEPDRFGAADAVTRAAVPSGAHAMLRLLTRSRFLVGLSESAFIGDLKQVTRYMAEPDLRAAAQNQVDQAVSNETRVIVGHSLGSVVAYEALHAFARRANWSNVKTLVTLGSPLGIRNLIFERLMPTPVSGQGQWPSGIERWTNVADDGDIVALVKKLGTLFGENLIDIRVSNGARAHDVSPYLTAAETGQAIAAGLA